MSRFRRPAQYLVEHTQRIAAQPTLHHCISGNNQRRGPLTPSEKILAESFDINMVSTQAPHTRLPISGPSSLGARRRNSNRAAWHGRVSASRSPNPGSPCSSHTNDPNGEPGTYARPALAAVASPTHHAKVAYRDADSTRLTRQASQHRCPNRMAAQSRVAPSATDRHCLLNHQMFLAVSDAGRQQGNDAPHAMFLLTTVVMAVDDFNTLRDHTMPATRPGPPRTSTDLRNYTVHSMRGIVRLVTGKGGRLMAEPVKPRTLLEAMVRQRQFSWDEAADLLINCWPLTLPETSMMQPNQNTTQSLRRY